MLQVNNKRLIAVDVNMMNNESLNYVCTGSKLMVDLLERLSLIFCSSEVETGYVRKKV